MVAGQFTKTFSITLAAKVAASVLAVIFGALGYYNEWGAYLLTWAPYATPEAARIVFWTGCAIMIAIVAWPFIASWRRRVTWAERNQLELSAIACLSVGKSADEPYDVEPQLSRHRALKDAVRSGALKTIDLQGEKPNVHTQVSREDLRSFASETSSPDLLRLLARWDKLNPPRERVKLTTHVSILTQPADNQRDETLPLLEAARVAFSETEDTNYAVVVSTVKGNTIGQARSDKILGRYATAIGKYSTILGCREPSTKMRPQKLDNYDLELHDGAFRARERSGLTMITNLRVSRSDLNRFIERVRKYPDEKV